MLEIARDHVYRSETRGSTPIRYIGSPVAYGDLFGMTSIGHGIGPSHRRERGVEEEEKTVSDEEARGRGRERRRGGNGLRVTGGGLQKESIL